MMKLFLGFLLVLSVCLVQAQNITFPGSSATPTVVFTTTHNSTVAAKSGSGRMDCWAALLPLATAACQLLHRFCVL